LNPNRHSVSIIVKLIRDSVYALLMVIIFTGVMLLRCLDN
jgi:hypothetical protein